MKHQTFRSQLDEIIEEIRFPTHGESNSNHKDYVDQIIALIEKKVDSMRLRKPRGIKLDEYDLSEMTDYNQALEDVVNDITEKELLHEGER